MFHNGVGFGVWNKGDRKAIFSGINDRNAHAVNRNITFLNNVTQQKSALQLKETLQITILYSMP